MKFVSEVVYKLSHDVASWSDITPCNKIDKPLVLMSCNDVHYNIA